MPIGATIPAASRPVSPDRTTFTSPLNPHHHHQHHHHRPRSPPQPLKTSAHALIHSATPIQTHISNLDKVLLKKPPPSAPAHHPISPASAASEDTAANPNAGGGLFSALNLSSLFSSSRKAAAEDMSPKSLTQLQRLLSLSPRPSPRSSIASNWRDFHGADDWSGLLDPLDENLRRELVRYGDLVQAAYHAFHSNPAASPSRPRHVILPDRSFHVTRSLFATSSVELPRWVESAAAAPWLTQRSSWIGYVAVCDAPREIVRMGRRDIVIALRGTATCLEWAENFRAGLVPLDDSAAADSSVPKVACGFKSLHRTPAGPTSPSLSAAVADEVRRLMELYEGEELSITITGHSLGAALSLLVADDLTSTIPNAPPIAVYSFGGPRVGNRAFADRLKAKGVKVLRVVNADDVITRVPGVLPAEEIGRRLGGRNGWASHVLESIDGYSHVGTELRVDSRASPFLRPGVDPNCSHDLEAYLHLVDGFMGSDCPFRSDAKRSLVRLLNHQRANVKPLYVSKAMDLGFNPFEPARVAVGSRVPGFLASPPGYLASPSH